MLVVLDFETYYSKEYSLSKMTTEEYIRDERFKVHGVGIKIGDRPAVYLHEENVATALAGIPWGKAMVLCHNTRFDGAILSWRYGIRPALWLDTMSMAKALFPHESASLANISKMLGLGEKGNELANFLGVKTLTPAQQEAMGRYCVNDVELTYKAFQKMKEGFPVSELKVIDQTLRMFTEPVLELDSDILRSHLTSVQEKQRKLLDGRDLTSLRSNSQFAALLEGLGVEPPTKISGKTGKQTFAFAKTDEGMLALLEHEKPEVQALAAARLGVKSSIEESRTLAFIGIAERGKLPIALNYFGAGNSGRDSGAEKINPQNMPRGGALRKSIVAPEGQTLVVVDFAAVEARVLAWVAGQSDLIQQFESGRDVYCEFASKVFDKPVTKSDERERALGKLAILGLGFGLGWRKFSGTLAVGAMGNPPILFTPADLEAMGGRVEAIDPTDATTKLTGIPLLVHCSAAKHLVDSYRSIYAKIPAYWKTCDRILEAMHGGFSHQFGVLSTEKDRLRLPNGLSLHYRDLRRDGNGWKYSGRRGEQVNIFGAKICENLTQALARILMTDALLEVSKRYRVVLRVHDELVCCVPEGEAEDCLAFVTKCMSVAPKWAKGLPLAASRGFAKSYGEVEK